MTEDEFEIHEGQTPHDILRVHAVCPDCGDDGSIIQSKSRDEEYTMVREASWGCDNGHTWVVRLVLTR